MARWKYGGVRHVFGEAADPVKREGPICMLCSPGRLPAKSGHHLSRYHQITSVRERFIDLKRTIKYGLKRTIQVYNATSGDNWANNDNWLSDKPLGEWHGVTTDSDGRVRRLDLSGNQLSEVPPELGSLSNLTHLYLYDNQLSGVPPELGSLSNLEWLWLQRNQLSDVPSELGSLSNLEWLHLSGNQLSGVPPELGSLSNLEWLWLQRNQLSEVPSELGSLSNLEWLDLSHNRLTEIPGELGNLSNLESLYLSSNELTGCIPEGLRDVANNDFQILGLDFCEVDSSDPLIVRYDANNNGTIEKIEVIAAINDYLFGAGDEAISKSDVIKLINLYLFG